MNNSLGNHDCPPKMSDGRHFTDYRPSGYVHDLILKQNGITNSFDLKSLMTTRALDLQKINKDYYENRNACHSCKGYYIPDPNGHVDYWHRYAQSIGYENPADYRDENILLPPIGECPMMTSLLPGQSHPQITTPIQSQQQPQQQSHLSATNFPQPHLQINNLPQLQYSQPNFHINIDEISEEDESKSSQMTYVVNS